MKKLTLPAPAKLNLFLHINGQRDNGMHELQTIFQLLDFGDTISFQPRDDGDIILDAKIPGVSAANNLILHAAKMIQRQDTKRRGAHISLTKRLPLGGGVGGGSSNAATTLHGLNRLWELNLTTNDLIQLGLQLGADVPVFIRGESCWAEGIGELITPMKLPEHWFLVVKPPISISTAEIFFDKQLTRDTPKQKMSTSLVETGGNDCQATVIRRYPIVAEALNWLNQYSTAQMTGTGSCIFARFESKAVAEKVKAKLPAQFKGFVARGVNQSPLLTALAANR